MKNLRGTIAALLLPHPEIGDLGEIPRVWKIVVVERPTLIGFFGERPLKPGDIFFFLIRFISSYGYLVFYKAEI